MADARFRFTHIMAGGTWRIRGSDVEFDTDASLRRVVEVVRGLDPSPAFAVLGGDLASPDILHRDRTLTPDEYAPSYARLKEILGGLPCRAHYLMGNHDNLEALNRAQLAWLERDLAAHRDVPAIVFVHHHPWPLGHAWMDTMPLRNGGDVMAMLGRHHHVKWVIGGHVHSEQV